MNIPLQFLNFQFSLLDIFADEGEKRNVSIVLCIGHALAGAPKRGWKQIQFRWNVTKGLVEK